ncbi:MAG TPA: zinc-binding dehydrogenase [Streptosporangiaceae bacterium]|nr:zinc-binding dehydrogenase [Streptosporangiaceae bacterium]
MLLGHEIAGEVIAAGPQARGWPPGDLVTGLGGSGFASLAVLDADRILPVPAGIDPALALAPGRADDRRLDIVLEATGVTAGLTTASALVRPYGTLCVVGYQHAGDAMMDMDLWYEAVTIVNGFCPDQTRLMRAMREALDLIARHRFSYAPLVTHRFGLDEVDRAYALMDARADGIVKAVLIP